MHPTTTSLLLQLMWLTGLMSWNTQRWTLTRINTAHAQPSVNLLQTAWTDNPAENQPSCWQPRRCTSSRFQKWQMYKWPSNRTDNIHHKWPMTQYSILAAWQAVEVPTFLGCPDNWTATKMVGWLSSVLCPRQHSIGYMGDGFYRSKDPTSTKGKSWKSYKGKIRQRKQQNTHIHRVRETTVPLNMSK